MYINPLPVELLAVIAKPLKSLLKAESLKYALFTLGGRTLSRVNILFRKAASVILILI